MLLYMNKFTSVRMLVFMEKSRIGCVRYYLAEEESFLRDMVKWEKEKRPGQQPEP